LTTRRCLQLFWIDLLLGDACQEINWADAGEHLFFFTHISEVK